ncbi:hypothetical protein EH223_07930 [candidate division KSB1 bacterium]|nr:hypothetical protein [candidate division KSB1 bacterium]RQW04121.1 MAG: hypothetical protein EH223_07930 [candidate division KSB1 bacterium]
MKRSLLFMLLLLASSTLFARTQPGKTAFAARITSFPAKKDTAGYEFGFGRMLSPGSMILLDLNLLFYTDRDEERTGTITNISPWDRRFAVAGYPEYRFYISPRNRVVPYFGFYGLIGIDTKSIKTKQGNAIVLAREEFGLTLGGGATLGAEFFFNDFISLAAHARFAQYSFSSNKDTDYMMSPARISINNAHQFRLNFQPALYVRLYF